MRRFSQAAVVALLNRVDVPRRLLRQPLKPSPRQRSRRRRVCTAAVVEEAAVAVMTVNGTVSLRPLRWFHQQQPTIVNLSTSALLLKGLDCHRLALASPGANPWRATAQTHPQPETPTQPLQTLRHAAVPLKVSPLLPNAVQGFPPLSPQRCPYICYLSLAFAREVASRT